MQGELSILFHCFFFQVYLQENFEEKLLTIFMLVKIT